MSNIRGTSGRDELRGTPDRDNIDGLGSGDEIRGGPRSDEIHGGGGGDVLHGQGAGDFLSGDAGNDALFGDAGADFLNGGDGNDALWGGAGADFMVALEGNDALHGGEGRDTFAAIIGDQDDARLGRVTVADFGDGDGLALVLQYHDQGGGIRQLHPASLDSDGDGRIDAGDRFAHMSRNGLVLDIGHSLDDAAGGGVAHGQVVLAGLDHLELGDIA